MDFFYQHVILDWIYVKQSLKSVQSLEKTAQKGKKLSFITLSWHLPIKIMLCKETVVDKCSSKNNLLKNI